MAAVRTGSFIDAGALEDGASSLQASLVSALSKTGPVVVDLTSVRVIDGATVALLVAASREYGARRPLAIVATPELAEAFREWRLDSLWVTGTDAASVRASVGISGGGIDG